MPVYKLDDRLLFPPAQLAEADGLIAVGGDLSPERLLLAYRSGIFPWYSDGWPILWHSPDPRTVLPVDQLAIPRSTRRAIRKGLFEVRIDTAFDEVISACRTSPRQDEEGTWITPEMEAAYVALHRSGSAHSAEAWQDGRLVGGLYGVAVGALFFGESMFCRVSEASKVAWAVFASQLQRWDFELIDCQVHTDHLERFGAVPWPRDRFLEAVTELTRRPDHQNWRLESP